ncbi:MAG: hypothetical protein IT380_09040 [Myxococcales bacterium]|nr:hypothetical protein [Myxococcales bacterium]
MLEVLSAALARRNPKAYIAHFLRLDPEAQRAFVGGLTPEEHRLHVGVVGESLVLGLVLTVTADDVTMTASLAGGTLRTAQGWQAARTLQDEVWARAEALGGTSTATGLLKLPIEQLTSAPLSSLGWRVESVELWVDPSGGPPTWRVRGVLPGGGTFWSPAQVLTGSPQAWETRLRAAASSLGARFVLVAT